MQSVKKDTQAVTCQENEPRVFQTISGIANELCEFIQPSFSGEKGSKIHLELFIICKTPIMQETNSSAIKSFINTHLS